jgi:hypothetical protein
VPAAQMNRRRERGCFMVETGFEVSTSRRDLKVIG